MTYHYIRGAHITEGMLIEHPSMVACKVVSISKNRTTVLLTVYLIKAAMTDQFTVSNNTKVRRYLLPELPITH